MKVHGYRATKMSSNEKKKQRSLTNSEGQHCRHHNSVLYEISGL